MMARWQRYFLSFPAAFTGALLIRVYLLATHGTINTDGVLYLRIAGRVTAGNWPTAFANTVFNLYPVLISLTWRVLGLVYPVSQENAAYVLNLVCGMLLLYPLYRIARRHCGDTAAGITAWLLAIHPMVAGNTCDIVREPVYWFLSAWALALFLDALREEEPRAWSSWRLMAAGVLVLVAALVRLEALALLACFALAILVARLRLRSPWHVAARVRALALLLLLVPLVAAGAAGWIKHRTGRWDFARVDKLTAYWSFGHYDTSVPFKELFAATKDDGVNDNGSLNFDEFVRVRFMEMAVQHRYALWCAEIGFAHWRGFHWVGLIAVAAGLWCAVRRGMVRASEPIAVCLAAMVVVYMTVFARYALTHFYLSSRHVMTLALPLFVFAGAWAPALRAQRGIVRATWAALIGLCVVVLMTAVLQPIRRNKLILKTCGEALAAAMPTNAVYVLSASLTTLGYYAHRPMRVLPPRPEHLRVLMAGATNRYLLLNILDPAQAACEAAMTAVLQRVSIALPSDQTCRISVLTDAVNQPGTTNAVPPAPPAPPVPPVPQSSLSAPLPGCRLQVASCRLCLASGAWDFRSLRIPHSALRTPVGGDANPPGITPHSALITLHSL